MKPTMSLLSDQLQEVKGDKSGHEVCEMLEEMLEHFEYFEWNDQVAMACCGAFTFDPDTTQWDQTFYFWPELYVEQFE